MFFPSRAAVFRTLASLGAVALAGSLAACGSDHAGTGAAATHQVTAADDSCTVDETSLEAGEHSFKIENAGSDVTEVYIYGKDGEDFSKILGEKENIGPGTSQSLEVDLSAGEYQVACKPGMTGDGIRTTLTVTGDGGSNAETDEGYDRELEFVVEEDGTVEPPSELTAAAGEQIEFKLENESGEEHYLEVLDPDGSELGEGEAASGGRAEFVVELSESGAYRIKVFAHGNEDHATVSTLRVG